MNKEKSDKFYMEVAELTAKQSYAIKRKVGAIIVQDNRIISEGFNGTPSGFENICEDPVEVVREIRKDMELLGYYDIHKAPLRTRPEVLHAESNAITKCAKYGNSTKGATLYVTCSPCIECAKLIIQAGIKRVVYSDDYRLLDGLELLRKANIEVEKYGE